MPKKLTITVDAEVYDRLHSVVGHRRISRFPNDLARPTLSAMPRIPAPPTVLRSGPVRLV